MNSEREDLESLLHNPGWIRLAAWAKQEWADQVVDLTEQAANNMDDGQALTRLRQVLAAKKAVDLVMQWPARRLSVVTKIAAIPEPSMSRQGY